MAVRSGRNTGLILTLVFFVFTTLLAAVLCIVFYSQLEEEQKKTESAKAEMAKFVEPARLQSSEIRELIGVAERQQPATTVTQVLQQEIKLLKQLLHPNPSLEFDKIEKSFTQPTHEDGEPSDVPPITEYKSGPVLTHLKQLVKKRRAAEQAAKEAQDKADAALAESTKLSDALAAKERDHAAQLQTLNTEIAALKKTNEEFRQEKTAQISKIETSVEQSSEQAAAERRALEEQIQKLKDESARKDVTVASLRRLLEPESIDVPDPSKEIDGMVVSVNNDRNLLYVNLGRKDHLVKGMRFEVYDPIRGVQVNATNPQTRSLEEGKATIEVVTVQEDTSTCRVIRQTFGQPVLEKDVIANLIYDKDRVYKFYVYGDFDLDGDGEATLSDREMVLTLIKEWGGEVVDADRRDKRLAALLGDAEAGKSLLPHDTDFLVIGQEPEPPAPVPGGFVTPKEQSAMEAAKQRWQRFNDIRQEATNLSVPVLNQNRFLALIGYAGQDN